MSTNVGVWLGALFTIAAYSYLYKENRLYRMAEHIYVGAGAGYALAAGYLNVMNKAWNPLVQKGQVIVIVPLLLGLMLFLRFTKNLKWVSRIPLALVVGMGAAIAMRGAVGEQFISQVKATMIPINSINNLILIFGTIGTLTYFFFTFPKNSVVRVGSNVGRWILMITFGAAFGNAVMGRISLYIGVLQFMFGSWIKLIK